ncbi:putative sodium-dependent excitatory amino acid transporter glt-4 [Trichinella spiralis]|uniref:Amino acid transporter n=1 Tax=Trichinella spiralis TaxID=6334 RepID=A0A0V1BV62_TRISP|nr:putative sodium-dependent excitatory amino acid transporter glt-4 [Trichinella spiralis]
MTETEEQSRMLTYAQEQQQQNLDAKSENRLSISPTRNRRSKRSSFVNTARTFGHRCHWIRACHMEKDKLLLLFTVIACVLGLVLGICLRGRSPAFTPRELMYLRFPGELFLRMLQMLILPLIVSSIISSIAQLNSKTAGELGLYTVLYYFTTTLLAVVEGIILVMTIRPGDWSTDVNIADDAPEAAPCLSSAVDTILDLISRNLFPENLIEACFQSVKTCMTFSNVSSGGNGTYKIPTEIVMQLSQEEKDLLLEAPQTRLGKGMNILGLIFFSVVFGLFISLQEEEGEPLRDFFKSLESVMMKMIAVVIWYAPAGIIFLTAHQIVVFKDPVKELQRLVGYMITVLSGLAIHAFVILPLIMLLVARRNPIKYAYGILPALLTALGTSSSSATLPLTIKCCEKNNGVDPRVTRFVLPLGATINMDGTALLTATLASIGAAGIPQAGIVTMLMVLMAIGLPTKYFILIIPVDWFLDRIRTTVNVFGDSLGAGVVHKLCINYLIKSDEERARKYSVIDGQFSRKRICSTSNAEADSTQLSAL